MSKDKKKWLITGVPGTGKTTLGDFLSSQKQFKHLNFESSQDFQSFTNNPDAFIVDLDTGAKDVVITWGFVPDQGGINIVQFLRQKGFKLFWLDGDRVASFKAFKKRGTVSEEPYYLQMLNIERSKVIQILSPFLVNPFNADGSFKNLEDIIEEFHKY